MKSDTPVENVFRLTAVQRAGLRKLRIKTVRDLLYHFPSRYESAGDVKRIADVAEGETAILYGSFKTLEMKR